ncbi:CG14657 [Drosophila busckii]|uniref:CG14657 n=1 Tax=Drosophila busckii TaxID=30019 RepID=A0A0M4ELW1_DROBS|nr:uncharacterized protein LOC108601932 [Drosophila busckii]ALC45388.1 CG14657 [Drosophila busckii]
MLLAASGQAAPYTYDSNATRKISSNNNNNSNASTGTPTASGAAGTATTGSTVRPTTASSIASNAATAIMKTLSVRLHRGTEFIKDTVTKALVMSATPVMQVQAPAQVKPLEINQNFKRKPTGVGGVIAIHNKMERQSCHEKPQLIGQYTQPYVAPTAAFLRRFTVAPSALHRSAQARKRNPSTDSLLMDLCLFKPIRPVAITPIKINKARGFELKRPKFVPPSSNLFSDDDDDEDDEQEAELEQHKPNLSTLILPQYATASAFVPHQNTANTHTSGSDTGAATATDTVKPKATATKRRRRAPLLAARKRRKAAPSFPTAAEATLSTTAIALAAPKVTVETKKSAPKRKRRSISPLPRSPPMTRQRARLQISASSGK